MQIEFLMLVLSMLFFFSIVADKIGYRFGVPALLLFLAVGMLFGSHGLGAFLGGGLEIDIDVAQVLSTLALCIILFSDTLHRVCGLCHLVCECLACLSLRDH